MLKGNVNLCASKLTELLNSCISNWVFPDELKLEDISLIFKSVDSATKQKIKQTLSERPHNAICIVKADRKLEEIPW